MNAIVSADFGLTDSGVAIPPLQRSQDIGYEKASYTVGDKPRRVADYSDHFRTLLDTSNLSGLHDFGVTAGVHHGRAIVTV